MISALKRVTNLMEGNNLGVVVEGFAECRKNRVAETSETLISVVNARALLTMGELAQFKGVHHIVLPSFNNLVCKGVVVIGGEEERSHDSSPGRARNKHKLSVNSMKIPKDTRRPPLMEEDWVVSCLALYQSINEEGIDLRQA